jgi:hypothetical protein
VQQSLLFSGEVIAGVGAGSTGGCTGVPPRGEARYGSPREIVTARASGGHFHPNAITSGGDEPSAFARKW